MHTLTSLHSKETLDDECLHVMIKAFDDAWSMLQGSIFAAHQRAEETREILERRIIEIARRGERDPIRMRKEALAHFNLSV